MAAAPAAPIVAVIGSTGFMGKILMNSFLPTLSEGRFKELRVLASGAKISGEIVQGFVAKGAKVFEVDFKKVDTLVAGFKGADAVVSTLGMTPGSDEAGDAILEALLTTKVKVYIPSEFGTNHYKINYKHSVFERKKAHFEKAKKKGVKAIRMLPGDVMEASFGKWFGLDCVSGNWELIGKGETQVAMTAEGDLGRFTIEAVLKAFKDPAGTPDLYEIYSDMKTMKEYAKVFGDAANRPIKIQYTPLDKAKAEYQKTSKFEYLLQILFEEGAYDYTKSEGNKALNPGGKLWKLKTIQDYAKETDGIPWKDFTG